MEIGIERKKKPKDHKNLEQKPNKEKKIDT